MEKVQGWTLETLKEYHDTRINELDRRITQAIDDRDARVDLAMSAAKEAVVKADSANERRLDLLNEFRGQQADEARKYAPMLLVDEKFFTINQRMSLLERSISDLSGRAIALAGIGVVIGGVVGALIGKFLG